MTLAANSPNVRLCILPCALLTQPYRIGAQGGFGGPRFHVKGDAVVGKTIARYTIIEKLGEGGMGVVYKAQDTRLQRFVAIKVLPPESVADPQRERRFVQEAKAASALNHPNIVHVYDIDRYDSALFIAMEYVAGQTLDRKIPANGMPLGEALRISVQIAGALTAAHEAGVVHRDLKPGNVMVGDDGRVRVVDFGLAKLTEPEAVDADGSTLTMSTPDASPRTEEGSIVGTAAYISPEQAEARHVDARSDIFSFGCLLYEMLCGQRAFQGTSTMSTLAAVLKDEPRPMQEVAVAIPEALERIVNRCLRKDPERRFQVMKDVKVALEDLKQESDSGALAAVAARSGHDLKGRASTGPVARATIRNWVGVSAILGLAMVAAWLWFSRPEPVSENLRLSAVPLTSFPGNEFTPGLSPDGNQVAYSWNGPGANGNGGNAAGGDNYDIYVQVLGAGEPLRLTDNPALEWAPAWSPDGREIRFYRYWREGRFALVSIPPLPGRERVLWEYPFPPELPNEVLLLTSLAWSPDGTHTAYPGESGVLIRRGEESVATLGDQPGGTELFPSFAPDGRSIAFVWQSNGASSDLYVTRLSPEFQPVGELKRLATGMRYIGRLAWTSDSREIIFPAATEAGTVLWRIDATGRSAPRRLGVGGEDAWSPAISRDGKRLVFERRTENSSLWHSSLKASDSPAERITASTRSDWTPSFSPDGTRIAFASNRSGSTEIWMAESDGSNAAKLTSLRQFAVVPEWSPDGSSIVFQNAGEAGNDLYVVGTADGAVRRLTQHPDDELQPSWSPDGKWIYFMSNRGGKRQIWRIPPAGGEATMVTADGGEFARLSPDGTTLYFTKGIYGSHELWKIDVSSGAASKLDAPPIYDWGLVIAEGWLYFSGAQAGGAFPVQRLELKSGRVEPVAKMGLSPFAKFSISPDGKWLLYSQREQANSDLMLVDGFR